jgi:hypothetical protein
MAAIEVQQYGERLLQVYGDAIRRLRSKAINRSYRSSKLPLHKYISLATVVTHGAH